MANWFEENDPAKQDWFTANAPGITPTAQELSTLEAPEGSPQREDINRGVAGNLFAPPGVLARDPTLSELINASMPRGVQEAQRDERQIPMAPPLPEQGRFEQGGVLGVLDPALEAGESVARGLAPRTDSWGHLITDLGSLATPPVGSVQELMEAPENARKDYANARAQMSGASLNELPFPERLDPVTAAQQMPEGPEKQQALLNAGTNVVAQMLMAKGIAHGIARPEPSHLRTEPLVPDPPPSPPRGPTTIAGDVSRALERRFTTSQPTGAWEIGPDGRPTPVVPRTFEAPSPLEPAPSIEETLAQSIRKAPELPVDPDVTQSLARQIMAQRVLTPDVIRRFAENAEPVPLEIAPEPTGPVSETAVEKAMRTSSPQPLRSATELEAPSFTLPDIPGVTRAPIPGPEQPAPVSQQRVVPSETAVTPGARERMILNKRTEILKRKKELEARAANGEQGLEPQLAAVEAELNDTKTNPVVHAPPPEVPVQHGEFAKPGYTAVETPERISAAAVRYPDGSVQTGPSHAHIMAESPIASDAGFESGFVTSKGRFLNQQEAHTQFGITKADQIVPPEPYTPEAAAARAAQPQTPQKPSKIGQSIEAKAVEAKLTEGFGETAGYDPITIKDQAARASGVVESSPEHARAIVRGEAPLPEGLRGTSLITAMEEHLLRNPDAQVAYELANSPLTSATSAAAQEMRLMRERVPDSLSAKFSEIKAAREAGAKLRGETPAKVKADITKEVVKSASKRPTWEQFVKEIVC